MGSTRKFSGWFAFLLLLLLCLLLISQVLCSHAADALKQGESMRDGETLVSSGGNVFELGFFSPRGTTNRYVGIWYMQVSVRTVVWVANRENHLMTNTSALLTINDDGNLMILDGSGESIMLTSFSPSSTNSNRTATLLDNGNFVLRNEAGRVVWQSFDYPTDTMLAGMKIGVDLKTGRNWSLVSWTSAEDPAPGPYSFRADPDGTLRFLIKHNGDIYWSSGAWNGVFLSLVPEMKRGYIHNFSFVASENEKLMTYSLSDTRRRSRVVLDSSGQLQQWQWLEDGQYWSLLWAQPRDECEIYGACGANARCDISSPPVRCNCLEGFFSSDGRSNRSSGRCVRHTSLMCGDEDGFYPVANVKFPDQSQYDRYSTTPGIDYCESKCRSSCSCTAYAATYDNGTGGCLFWSGVLTGLRDSALYVNGDGFATGDLYIRLAGPDLSAIINKSKKKMQIWVIIVIVVSVVVLSTCLFLCCLLRWRKFKRKGRTETSEQVLSFELGTAANKFVDANYLGHGQTKGPDLPLFGFATVEAATDNFSPANKLGQGGFGPVYKGKLPEGREIAVKRLSKSSGQGLEEFRNELILISKLQHRNLVRLLGWCVRGEEKILIYEYMPNKSLDAFLFDKTKQSMLDWGKRVQIVEGIAQGLLYLHQYSRLMVIHRDLKASNILLDNDMNPKISDFGMARVFGADQSQANTNRVVGTYGYMSPEYAMRGVFSIKSDVFSFGVLLLEIVGGKKNSTFHQPDGPLNLLAYAWELWKEGRSLELIDPMLVDSAPASELVRYVHVSLLCVQDSATDRPAMSDVVHMLTNKTATVAVPKQPAFYTQSMIEVDTSSSKPTTCSVNDVTISEIEEGR